MRPPALKWASPSCFRATFRRRASEGPRVQGGNGDAGHRLSHATPPPWWLLRQAGGGWQGNRASPDADGAPAAAGRRIARGCLDVPREHLRRPRRGTRKERFGYLSVSRDTGAFFTLQCGSGRRDDEAWPVESPEAMGRNQGTRDENFAVKVQCPTVTSSPRRLDVGANVKRWPCPVSIEAVAAAEDHRGGCPSPSSSMTNQQGTAPRPLRRCCRATSFPGKKKDVHPDKDEIAATLRPPCQPANQQALVIPCDPARYFRKPHFPQVG
ncbi:hypothetical protein HU200_060744 [Digitaria exilis]|uniref:Uncharacterized protein n=1 Tax=Digitaria exilis TaxID=1010633 RepID=A0A835A620_9POAL|nr:hypothetical protein HU200_060744 [Digitaria exilis]